MYYDKLMANKELSVDKWLTLPKQVSFDHPDVLLYVASLPTDPPKAEPKEDEKPKPKKKGDKE